MNEKFKEQPKLVTFTAALILSIVAAFMQFSFSAVFWIILVIWIIIYMVFFIKPSMMIMTYFWITLLITFTLSTALSLKIISFPSDGSTTVKETGTVLSDCTSTISNQSTMINGWKSTIYSAALSSNTPSVSESNNVLTFSYDGIKNKTESNSLYARIEKVDSSTMTGYATAMELCNANNKAVKAYTTAQSDYTIGDNISASEHILHKGLYIFEPGEYRADIYVKTTDNVWHLVDRMTGIKITN